MSEDKLEYKVEGREVRRETRLPYADPRFVPPTPKEVAEVIRRLELTGATAGKLLGVDGRTIRRWIGSERDMPYSAWRLLLIEAGLALVGAPADAARKVAEGRG